MSKRLGERGHIVVLGGDGFCGWPIALHLSAAGYEVTIVDDLSRRDIDRQLGTSSLTPIASLDVRIAAWLEATGARIGVHRLSLGQDFERLTQLLKDLQPTAVVHAASQRSAPYSMKTSDTMRFTVRNNLCGTHDLLVAMVTADIDTHLIHFGSMGVYGYQTADIRLPEGYLPVTVQTDAGPKDIEILYPADPGSVYHMTKTQDQLFFKFYAKNYKLRITDLHQGVVWGTQTDETVLDERLINRFDYDGDFGTVLNRFLMQAAIGYPLTVYGKGGQSRAFIHIRDTVRCIEIAVQNPPERGDRVQIFNQATETHRVIDLARSVSEATGVPFEQVDNPRIEAEENDLDIHNRQLLERGLKPTRLSDGLMEEVRDVAKKYAHRCDRTRIPCSSRWERPASGSNTGSADAAESPVHKTVTPGDEIDPPSATIHRPDFRKAAQTVS